MAAEQAAQRFAALGDSTRLSLVIRLGSGERLSIAALARDLPISRQAVAKHLRVLEEAGLVDGTTKGREQLYTLIPGGLSEARAWLDEIAAQWDDTLGRLKAFVEHKP